MSARAGKPAPFVVGVPRSGTTLLRLMLDAHPDLAIPPETYFVTNLIEAADEGAGPEEVRDLLVAHRRWGDLGIDSGALLDRLRTAARSDGTLAAADAVRAPFELYAEAQGKHRWGDKTPAYLTKIGAIGEVLPEARFIHLIRDGRAVAVSILAMPIADRPMRGPTSAGAVAKRWRGRIERAREQGRGLPYYLEVRYEDLVLETEATLERVCSFLDLDPHPGMLRYHASARDRLGEMARDLPARDDLPVQPSEARIAPHELASRPPEPERIGSWREEMSDADRVEFERVAGGLLSSLGYELEGTPGRRLRGLVARMRGAA